MEEDNSKWMANRAMDSAFFMRFTRVSITVITLVGVPAAAYGIKRIIESGDVVSALVASTSIRMGLLEQSVRFYTEQNAADHARVNDMLKDHELRLREVEARRRLQP